MQNARPLIEHLLAKGKLEAAIEGSLILARHYGDQERSNISAQQSARYHTLLTDVNAGTLNDEDYRLERARINRAMLDLAQSMPVGWMDEALKQANFSAKAFDTVPAPHKKSFLEKWGLVLGLVASLMGILGVTLKDVFFQKKEDKVAQTAEPETGSTIPKTTEQQAVKETKTVRPLQKQNQASKGLKDKLPTRTTLAPRHVSQFCQVDLDVERGKGEKWPSKRRTGNPCAGREDFSGGKAYVTEDMVQYYYIDTSGKKLKLFR